MTHPHSKLALVSTLFCALSFGAQADSAPSSEVKVQRYTFTYNFNKPSDYVIHRINETLQYIDYELIAETQAAAHYNLFNQAGGMDLDDEMLAQTTNDKNNLAE